MPKYVWGTTVINGPTSITSDNQLPTRSNRGVQIPTGCHQINSVGSNQIVVPTTIIGKVSHHRPVSGVPVRINAYPSHGSGPRGWEGWAGDWGSLSAGADNHRAPGPGKP